MSNSSARASSHAEEFRDSDTDTGDERRGSAIRRNPRGTHSRARANADPIQRGLRPTQPRQDSEVIDHPTADIPAVAPEPGAPDYPLTAKQVELIKAGEVKVAQLARKSLRKEVQSNQSHLLFLQSRKELAEMNMGINKLRLRKAAKNVRIVEGAHQAAVIAAESEEDEEEEELVPTPPLRSSPPPEDEVVDLTGDEAED